MKKSCACCIICFGLASCSRTPSNEAKKDNPVVAPTEVSRPALTEEQRTPMALVERALAAHGGEAVIGKARKGVLRSKETTGDGVGLIDQEEWFDLPNRWKRISRGQYQQQVMTSFDLFVDKRHWQWDESGQVSELEDGGNATPYFGTVTRLLELKSKMPKLSAIAPIIIDNEVAYGIHAVFADGEGDFYFDAPSGLFTVVNFQLPSPQGDIGMKITFSDHKMVDGIKLPHLKTTTVTPPAFLSIPPRKSEFKITEIRIMDSLPDGTFSLPR